MSPNPRPAHGEPAPGPEPAEERVPVARRLRVALCAYPRAVRRAQEEMLLSLACDMVDGGASSTNREALGLVRGGLVTRAGALADAPWEEALRRVALPIAGVLLAIVCGSAAFSLRELAWPGWSWIAVVAAPGVGVAGLRAGRRAPVALAALSLFLLGVAQANGRLATVHLEGSLDWSTGAFSLPLMGCAIPGALLVLAAATHARRPASRSVALATLAWVATGAVAVRLALSHELAVGELRLDGLAICIAAYAIAAVLAAAAAATRRRRDPAGMLAGTLAVATILPPIALYGLSTLPLGDGQALTLLAAATVATTVTLLHVARLTPTTGP